MSKKIEEYFCSIHGGDGDPNCEECKKNLRQLAKDNNANIIGDFK